ncbi:MAG TPA: ABC transporter permease [Gemmatimonadaceae bacterium]|nr:ABC transporter permease [Gemmatimonadaceae bacterium]
MDLLAAFLEATVRTATVLAFAALGEMLVQRSGVINIGLEGVIIAGAFGSLVGAGIGGLAGGVAAAILGGVAVAALFAVLVVVVRTDQIITGTAVTLFALGLTGVLYRILFGAEGAALATPTLHPVVVPLVGRIPVFGPGIFVQPVPAYVLYALVPVVWWWLHRTRAGLALRAVGENPEAARAAGISPAKVRFWAILAGGALGGMSGGTLVLAQAGTFAEGMSAGRGFIAIAIVALGRWHPVGAVLAALVFGAASAVQFLFQAMGWGVPYQLFLALPYVLTLLALAGLAGRARPPEALARGEVTG